MVQSSVAIEIKSLSKTYTRFKKPAVHAVEDINLSIDAGQVFGFLGANGAGKTTTIKMMCGLITPTTGYVRVNNYHSSHERSMAMRQIGAVLEGTRNVYWRLSAWENLMYFGRLKGCRGVALSQRAERLLRDLELWERRNDSIRLFSRGMQQKVAIACALIADPPIILLDEPTLGLDYQAARTVKELISRLAHEQGKTVVLTTHQLDMAQALCDRVAIIRQGRLLANQPLEELLDLFSQEYYQIRVKGLLEETSMSSFEGLTMSTENGETLLEGAIIDQAALHETLTRLREMELPLLSVARIEPNLEEVFMTLIEEGQKGERLEPLFVSHV